MHAKIVALLYIVKKSNKYHTKLLVLDVTITITRLGLNFTKDQVKSHYKLTSVYQQLYASTKTLDHALHVF